MVPLCGTSGWVRAIGDRITRWMRHRDLTLRQLAEAADMHTSSLHRVIHGQQEPRLGELERLAKALGTSVGELVEDDPPLRRRRRSA